MSLTKVSYSMIQGAPVNILDYGAVCDGVTDDTAAVQAAVDYCATFSQWPALYIPGKTLLTASINIDRPVDTETSEFRIIGAGPGAGFIVSSAIEMFSSTIAMTTSPVSEFIAFEGLEFQSTDAALSAYVLSEKFLRVRFDGCVFQAIRCIDSSTYTQDYRFVNCKARAWNGVFFASKGAYAIVSVANVFEFGAYGFYLYNNTASGHGIVGCSFTSTMFENCTGSFFVGSLIRGLNICGCYFEANDLQTLSFNADTGQQNQGISLTGNFFVSTAANQANANFFEVAWGNTFGGSSCGNQCYGRLHDITNTYASGVQINGDHADLVLIKGFGTSLTDPNFTNIHGIATGVDKNGYVYAIENTQWTALDVVYKGIAVGPGVLQNGQYVPIRIISGAENPQVNNAYYNNPYWTAGSRIFNSVPAVGQPKGWLCTVGGQPGTWVSEGNL